jgi:N-acetylneuraminate lyase
MTVDRTRFEGIITPMLTPLTDDERIDRVAAGRLVDRLLDEGQRGLYVTGSTGESWTLTDPQRMEMFALVGERVAARGRGEVAIAHVGGVTTRRALAMTHAAAEAGCHAVAAIPPLGGRYGYEELTDYYAALADESPLPLILYHIPSVSGYDFTRAQLSAWLQMANVMGMKYTSYVLDKLERLVGAHRQQIFFNGTDQVLMAGLLLGAGGAIGTSYNLIGRLAVRIFEACRSGDLATARKLQGAVNAFCEAYHACGGVRALKALAAERFGWVSARSVAPARIVPPQVYAPAARALDEALAAVDALG